MDTATDLERDLAWGNATPGEVEAAVAVIDGLNYVRPIAAEFGGIDEVLRIAEQVTGTVDEYLAADIRDGIDRIRAELATEAALAGHAAPFLAAVA